MFHLPFSFRYVSGPLLICTVSVLLWLLEPWSFSVFAYQREAVATTEWWRLLSANLVHSNLPHLAMNLLAMLAIWALHGEHYPARTYFLMLVLLSLFCTVCIYFFTPERSSYVGLSGVLHGFIVFGAVADIKQKIWLGWLLLAGICIKIAQEQMYGASAATEALINTAVATEAHLYGAIGGAICGLVWLFGMNKTP